MNRTKIIQNIVSSFKSITENLETLAEMLNENEGKSVAPQEANPKSKAEPKVNKTAESKESEAKQPTLEEVRAAMAEKSRNGHREGVKNIILKYGTNKLTTLNPEHYTAVMKEVSEIK